MQRGQLQAQAEPEEQNEVGLIVLHRALLGTTLPVATVSDHL